MLHIGDISYAVGYQSEWDEFHSQIQNMTGTYPYHVCMGNHEMDFPGSASADDPEWRNDTDSGGECGIPFMRRFPMPRPSEKEPWHSMTYEQVAVVFMSTEVNFQPGSPQHTALDKLLAAVDRSKTPWLIFAGHRPVCCVDLRVLIFVL